MLLKLRAMYGNSGYNALETLEVVLEGEEVTKKIQWRAEEADLYSLWDDQSLERKKGGDANILAAHNVTNESVVQNVPGTQFSSDQVNEINQLLAPFQE